MHYLIPILTIISIGISSCIKHPQREYYVPKPGVILVEDGFKNHEVCYVSKHGLRVFHVNAQCPDQKILDLEMDNFILRMGINANEIKDITVIYTSKVILLTTEEGPVFLWGGYWHGFRLTMIQLRGRDGWVKTTCHELAHALHHIHGGDGDGDHDSAPLWQAAEAIWTDEQMLDSDYWDRVKNGLEND